MRRHFETAGVDIASLLRRYLRAGPIARFGPADPRPRAVDLNRDLFPRDEFLLPRAERPDLDLRARSRLR